MSSFKPQVEVANRWESNQIVFATKEEAVQYAGDLMDRWLLVTNYRAIESTEPVNYSYADRRLTKLEPGS